MDAPGGMDVRIQRIETWLAEIPTRRPHKLSFGVVTRLQYVLVRVTSQDGVYGWGEAAVLGGPTWSEESAESIYATVTEYLAPLLLGDDAARLETLRTAWDARVRGNAFAKAAVEMALVDLRARSLEIPAASLLGGVVRDRVELSWSLAGRSVDEDIAEASRMMADGHRIFKIKVGNRPLREDLDRLRAIREGLGPQARLRVDVNQGWTRREAFAALDDVARVHPDFLEQPLRREDVEGLALLQARCPVPLMADESVTTLREAVDLIQRNAVRAFSLKVTKHGGLIPTLHVAAVARAMDVGCYVGCMIETGIGTAAYAHLCAALPALDYGCELFGPLLLAEDIVVRPVAYEPGYVLVPQGPGLGVDVDARQLDAWTRKGWHQVQEASSRS